MRSITTQDTLKKIKIMSLTTNAIATMFRMNGSSDNPSFAPTIQVIHVKKIDNKGGSDERFKVRLLFAIEMI